MNGHSHIIYLAYGGEVIPDHVTNNAWTNLSSSWTVIVILFRSFLFFLVLPDLPGSSCTASWDLDKNKCLYLAELSLFWLQLFVTADGNKEQTIRKTAIANCFALSISISCFISTHTSFLLFLSSAVACYYMHALVAEGEDIAETVAWCDGGA